MNPVLLFQTKIIMKTILITGAGSGLGLGTAIGLAKKGHKVIAGVQVWEQKSKLVGILKEHKLEDQIEIIKLDILNGLDCVNAYKYDIDILVNNARIGHTGPIAEIPVELVREVMETNVFSTLEFSQPIIRQMVDKKKGKVVFVSSVAGLTTSPFLGPYNASKHALEAIAQCLRDELHDFGVQVATINPGPYETGFNDRMYDTFEQWQDDDYNFTKRKTIVEASKALLDNQFDPQNMIDKMVEAIDENKQAFRTVWPDKVVDVCKEYQDRQYTLKADDKDKSKK